MDARQPSRPDEDGLTESKSDMDSDKKIRKYLKAHPELNGIISEFYNAVLRDKPWHVARYAADEFFGNPATVEKWTAKLGIANSLNN